MAGVMSMVLAQVAYMVTWRLMRHVRTGKGMQKYKTSPSVSVNVKLGSCLVLQLSVLLASVLLS